ncbi:hypothetical protein LTR36_009082 [Oleoguttula mirabilis]|uniref:DUF6594 domain-containing protein n=1 Tax=Oleoguttula mirabilis TaxID=1507867 RepID=A0AAV9J782_9PEZI|nr:hypothetical protein LTR36_009082 [Oleoguttula mirabilis]
MQKKRMDDSPEGYSRIATFQSSDCNFLLYRGFGYLHCRVLSALQHDIERLEKRLDSLDHWDKTHGDEAKLESQTRDEIDSARQRANKSLAAHFTQTRPEVLAELKLKLVEYDEVLLKTRDVCALQRPSGRDYASVRNWFRMNEPIIQQEMNFVRRKEDLITLRTGREYASFDSLVECGLSRLDSVLVRHFKCHGIRNMFLTPELRAKSSDEDIHYYAPERVETLVNAIITGIIFILLILPVVAMYELSDIGRRASPFEAIGILIIFTLLFGGAMSALTEARRQELFAASAAYCAVLVVFIGNFSTQTVVLVKQ